MNKLKVLTYLVLIYLAVLCANFYISNVFSPDTQKENLLFSIAVACVYEAIIGVFFIYTSRKGESAKKESLPIKSDSQVLTYDKPKDMGNLYRYTR